MRLIPTLITVCVIQLPWNVAYAAQKHHSHVTAHKAVKKAHHVAKQKKRKATVSKSHKISHKTPHKTTRHLRHKTKLKSLHSPYKHRVAVSSYKHNVRRATLKGQSGALTMSTAHRMKYQKARQTAMNKLMGQLGKPYQWGGSSPHTGFDCSGLVYYAYKDLVKFKVPRTANAMYHMRDAAPVKRTALQKGDLVFFRIHRRGTADHVGVYLGNGKFIQSPRTGKDIRISDLSGDYWQHHYVGARRMMTPLTVR